MIPYCDLYKVNEPHRKAIEQAIKDVLDSGYYLLGKALETFEKQFAAYCGTQHAIGVANGLNTLTLIIKAFINCKFNCEVQHRK